MPIFFVYLLSFSRLGLSCFVYEFLFLETTSLDSSQLLNVRITSSHTCVFDYDVGIDSCVLDFVK